MTLVGARRRASRGAEATLEMPVGIPLSHWIKWCEGMTSELIGIFCDMPGGEAGEEEVSCDTLGRWLANTELRKECRPGSSKHHLSSKLGLPGERNSRIDANSGRRLEQLAQDEQGMLVLPRPSPNI